MNKDFLKLLLALLIIIIIVITTGIILMNDDRLRKEKTKQYIIKPVVKEIVPPCEVFEAKELYINKDRYVIIHHLYNHDMQSSNWGDATIYFEGEAY